MSKKKNDLQEWLCTYDIPEVSEDRIAATIAMGKSYMDSSDFNENGLRNLLLSQLQYLPLSFWVIQTSLLAGTISLVCLLGYLSVPFYYPLTVLAIVIPLIVLLGVTEVSKSTTYDMWEIEQSSRCQLVKIMACRMLIIGLFDLFFVTVILVLVSYYSPYSVLRVVLYGMVPFNISCFSYLFTITKGGKAETSYHLIVCMVCLAIVFSFILRQQILFETAMILGWTVSYVASVLLLGSAIQTYLKHENLIGELAWNLQ